MTVNLEAGVRAAVARRRDAEYLAALAEQVHTTLEASWLPDTRSLRFLVGTAVEVIVDERELALTGNPLRSVAGKLRAAWHAYTPDVPPNVILGAE